MQFSAEDMTAAKREFYKLLHREPLEVVMQVREAIVEGKIDGRWYFDITTQCACIYGTVVKAKYPLRSATQIEGYASDLANRAAKPWGELTYLETFVHTIRPGQTPSTSKRSRLLLAWLDHYVETYRSESLTISAIALY